MQIKLSTTGDTKSPLKIQFKNEIFFVVAVFLAVRKKKTSRIENDFLLSEMGLYVN